MKSRITIEVDFEDGNKPFIQVVNNHQSPDVRDKLLTHFRQMLGHTSSWLKVGFPYFIEGRDECIMMTIHPITPDQLADEAKIMAGQVKMNNTVPEQPSITH